MNLKQKLIEEVSDFVNRYPNGGVVLVIQMGDDFHVVADDHTIELLRKDEKFYMNTDVVTNRTKHGIVLTSFRYMNVGGTVIARIQENRILSIL